MIKKFYGGKFLNKQELSREGINYPIKIEYYKIYDNEENKELNKYGLEVVKTEYKTEKVDIENKEVLRITDEEKIIDNILDKLKNNEVTPVNARYVVEDFVYNL